eukprot:CAMPEP_0178783456 /NCGR_PEP_ID=MMETSP0745-20121128/3697_1 /TAXON_ID=913974 /ORGANISM="Nitzschia punctata, Strain CCMP561" /LENGTH=198 /DNA_ID=CAMNT_0020440973 /DNA_START=9 /DNA_END=605 /DNA_ORIENTATION=-
MATAGGPFSAVANLVNRAAARQRRQELKSAQRTCSNCGKSEGVTLSCCSRCKSVYFCSKECQREQWPIHKKVCNELAESQEKGVVVPKPTEGGFETIFNLRSSPGAAGSGYRKPSNVQVGEKFYIKVQGGGPQMPLMIYDKSRECSFSVSPNSPGFEELRKAVNAEPTWQGRKTFVMASFDSKGVCTVYPSITSMKKW